MKVQYPEVATLYAADFDNLEVITRLLFPENVELIRGLRKRHLAELDFRNEASNLREVGANLRARGFEPFVCRVPTVPDSRLCTKHVLAMELLPGISLAAAIEREMADVARALGLSSSHELRRSLMRRVHTHFKAGGGGDTCFLDAAEAAAPLVRMYAAAVRRGRTLVAAAYRQLVACLGFVGLSRLLPRASELFDDASSGDGGNDTHADLTRAIRTLVRVHGCALLLDGVYNADPHPGNVLLLPDGRLGLIDYGMCGRLDLNARQRIARVVRGLESGDRDAVVDEYLDGGYRACWHSGKPHSRDVLFRLATFHLDRINLAPVRVEAAPPGALERRDGAGQQSGEDESATMMPVLKLFANTLELSVPDWIEQARRLGGLLIGVGSQAGRPISLAHEWAPIAEEVLLADGVRTGHCAGGGSGVAKVGRRATARLRTHLTGL